MGEAIVLFGIGMGDEGKGTSADAFARRYGISQSIRYGGSQGGHHVVLPDGMSHCCAQFSAATFAGARTHLSRYTPIEPESLLAEAKAFEGRGIDDPFGRLSVDPRCIVITPMHILVGRLRELLRGKNRHGSSGLGVGETILDAERGFAITVGDLRDTAQGRMKLSEILLAKWEEATELPDVYENEEAHQLLDLFRPLCNAETVYAIFLPILERIAIRADSDVCIPGSDTLLFEGAQGALIGRGTGFAPYIAKVRTTWHPAEELLRGTGRRVRKVGIMRAYGLRHGNGPFVTENPELLPKLNDPRNGTNPWQGPLRLGELDLVALRYGLKVNDGADMLALTHLDRLVGFGPFRVCTSYAYDGSASDLGDRFVWERHNGRIVITAILSSVDVPRLPSVADILFRCHPHDWVTFEGWNVFNSCATALDGLPTNARRFIHWLESPDGLNTPIGLISTGERSDQKLFLCD